jgi:DNA-binding beta-propeller fold protein YncE
VSRLRALSCVAVAAFACALIPTSAGAFELLQSWGNSGAGMFGPQVVGLATDSHGDVYVVDGESSSHIEEFSANGTFMAKWGTEGHGVDQMDYPVSIAVAAGGSSAGDLYVTDAGNRRVDEFKPDGEFIRAWGLGVKDGKREFEICTTSCQEGLVLESGVDEGGFEGPSGVAVDPTSGDVYVSEVRGLLEFSIQKFGPEGKFLGTVGKNPSLYPPGTPDTFGLVTAMATNSIGDLYAVELDNERVQEVNSEGDFLRAWGRGVHKGEMGPSEHFGVCSSGEECQQGGQGEEAGAFGFINRDAPASIAVDSEGNVWVPDAGDERVQEFNSEGAFVMGFGWGVLDGAEKFETCTSTCRAGYYGGKPPEFENPIGAAAAPSGCTIYVTDANANDLVDEFGCGGHSEPEPPPAKPNEPEPEPKPNQPPNVSTATGAGPSSGNSSSSTGTNNQPPPPPSAAQLEAALATAFGLPSAKLCYSKRSFKIHIQQPPGYSRVVSAEVFLGHKRERSLNKKGLTDQVVLTQLPYGTFTIRILARTATGTTLTGTRTYHTCRSKPIHPHGHPRL